MPSDAVGPPFNSDDDPRRHECPLAYLHKCPDHDDRWVVLWPGGHVTQLEDGA